MNEYPGRVPLWHLDLYRLNHADDTLGLEEAIDRAIVAVEWGEKLPSRWRAEALELTFEREADDVRRISASANGGRGLVLLAAWRSSGARRIVASRPGSEGPPRGKRAALMTSPGLAIEAATDHVEVLVRADGGDSLALEVEEVGHGHTRRLASIVERALERANVRARDLEWVAADLGPGSFTGVRVGLATAGVGARRQRARARRFVARGARVRRERRRHADRAARSRRAA